jgi:elongation factor Ts
MAITTQDINKLRQLTGVGMMDCKKALVEANGDFEKAIELLRKKGQKIATSRAANSTMEGVVCAHVNEQHNEGFIIALSCETDFVAKNDTFQQLAQDILLAAVAQKPANTQMLSSLTIANSTIQDCIVELMGKMGEKITISAYATLQSDVVVPYLHTGNKLSVLVGLQGATGDAVIAAGKDIAMQIAAMNPVAVSKEHVDPSVIEKELEIAREQAKNESSPANLLDNIAQGKLKKFFKENTLLAQPFVKNNTLSVAEYLNQVAPGLTVSAFKRITVGVQNDLA